MAEKVPVRAEDLGHLPDPEMNHKYKIKSDVVFITQEQDIEVGRRVWIKFRKARRMYGMGEEDEKDKRLYDHKVAMYVSQAGKWGIIWMDDSWWKIVRKKKLAKEETRWKAKVLKLDVQPIDIEESRSEAIQRCISEHI
jgi:hypothetical protein